MHVECDVSSMNRRRVPYHTRLKSNPNRLLYIIFFITQIHRVRFVSVNGEASRVKPSKNKFKKKFVKKILSKKFWGKKYGKKMLGKSYGKKILGKNYGKNILKKNYGKRF